MRVCYENKNKGTDWFTKPLVNSSLFFARFTLLRLCRIAKILGGHSSRGHLCGYWERMDTQEIKKILKQMTVSNSERFTLNGEKGHAKVVSIHDGDTCDVVFYHEQLETFLRFKCRLSGFDAPELDEPKGEETRNYLAHLCMGKDPKRFNKKIELDKKALQFMLNENKNTVYAEFGKEEKYGRALVTLKTSPRGKIINEMVRDYNQ